MSWTMDLYALGKKGCYRLVFVKASIHLQLLRPNAGHWEVVQTGVKVEKGRCVAAEQYDAANDGGGARDGSHPTDRLPTEAR